MNPCELPTELRLAYPAAAPKPSHRTESHHVRDRTVAIVSGRHRGGCDQDRLKNWPMGQLVAQAAAALAHTETLPRVCPTRGFATETFERVAIGMRKGNRNRQTVGGRLSTCFSVRPRLSTTSSSSKRVPSSPVRQGIRNNGRAKERQDSRDIAGPDCGDLFLRMQVPKSLWRGTGPYRGDKCGSRRAKSEEGNENLGRRGRHVVTEPTASRWNDHSCSMQLFV